MKKIFVIIAMAVLGVAAMSADTPASFPGGQDAMNTFISEKIVYPQTAIDNMIEGTVTVSFNVDADGTIKDVKVVRPLDPDLEEEAIKVVQSMPAWTPAKDASGNPIPQQVEIPVKFRLPQ